MNQLPVAPLVLSRIVRAFTTVHPKISRDLCEKFDKHAQILESTKGATAVDSSNKFNVPNTYSQ